MYLGLYINMKESQISPFFAYIPQFEKKEINQNLPLFA